MFIGQCCYLIVFPQSLHLKSLSSMLSGTDFFLLVRVFLGPIAYDQWNSRGFLLLLPFCVKISLVKAIQVKP
jgi:hypothetical protein